MGIPSVLIGTDVFSKVYDSSARLGGMPEIRWAKVPHPTGSLKEDELRDLAKAVTPVLVDVLTRTGKAPEVSAGAKITAAGGLDH
jgi:hypothetical protein